MQDGDVSPAKATTQAFHNRLISLFLVVLVSVVPVFRCVLPNQVSAVSVGQKIADKARELAWGENVDKATTESDGTAKFKEASKRAGTDGSNDCLTFVKTVIIDSGADVNYPKGSYDYESDLVEYMNNSTLWRQINTTNESDLQPGDVLVSADRNHGQNHIFIYLGNNKVAAANLNAWYGRVENLEDEWWNGNKPFYYGDIQYKIYRIAADKSENQNNTPKLSESKLEQFAQNNILFYDPSENEGGNCSTSPPSGKDITWIGDSYSVGAVDTIKSTFPGVDLGVEDSGNTWSPYYNIQDSKHLKDEVDKDRQANKGGPSGINILSEIVKNGNLRPYLVLALGTNDVGISESDANRILEEVSNLVGDTKVILVTAYTDSSKTSNNYNGLNNAIRNFSNSHPNFYVADWAKTAKDEYYKNDSSGIHPTGHFDKWVDLIYESLPETSAYTDGPIAISGSTIEEKVWSGLTSFLTAEQAAGVMGNMAHESNFFNPAMHEQALKNAHQPGFDIGSNSSVSYGLGLIQWSFGRRVRMYKYVQSEDPSLTVYLEDYSKYSPDFSITGAKFLEIAGEEVTDKLLSLEIQFLKDELENVESYSGILDTDSVYDAAKFFLEHVEIPQNPQIESHPDRVKDANKYYEEYKNFSGSYCNSTDTQKLIEYVKKYAWPTFHSAPYLDRMPDYAKAVEDRISQGLWVGGSVSGVNGIDCGGFVTTILNESGFDPNYNYGGNLAKGASAIDSGQLKFLSANQDTWKLVNSSWNTPISDESLLSPGDVGFSSCGSSRSCAHTYLYIGEVDGFETHIASASYGIGSGRAPMSGHEAIVGENINWFHKVK